MTDGTAAALAPFGCHLDDIVPALRLSQVSLRRGDKRILDEVGFSVLPGEHWALLGPNGAGKSTILSLCGAQNHPTSGVVDILGHRLGRVDTQALRRLIGHVDPRHPIQAPLTVEQVVLTGFVGTTDLSRRWTPTPEQLERAAGLVELVAMADPRHERWPTLSQGERGRALIARALVARPQLLLLDEPTTGLDLAAREQLLTAIDDVLVGDPEVASVMVTHHLEELPRTVSHAALIRRGALVAAGPVESVVTDELVSAAFDHPIDVHRVDGRWSASGRSRRT